jgi:hypothetical protein
MNRFLPTVLVLAACASNQSVRTDSAGATPVVEKQKIVNISHFDVGSCVDPAPVLPNPLNEEGVVGALVLARPAVLECFVDPKNRGAAEESGAAVKATVSETGVAYAVNGTHLTPSGVACVETALKRLAFSPLEKGSAPVVGSADFRHGPNSPAVKLGVNAASDVAGAVRLAQPGWCECWNGLGTNAPPALKAHLKLVPGKAVEVSFDPASDPTATALIGCLGPKLAALPPSTANTELTVHYPFLLVNSAASQETPDAQPELQFIQLDLIRAQRAAEVALKIGARSNALRSYDALVAKYKAKPASVLIKELKDKCAAMVASDQLWISTLKAQGEVDARSLALATLLKSKDERWTEAAAAAQAQVAASQADVKKAEEVKVADQAVCPKERK